MIENQDIASSDGVGVDVARRMCAGCPVRAECLEYALLHRIPQGVWGGASERERRRILRARRRSAGAEASLAEAMTAS